VIPNRTSLLALLLALLLAPGCAVSPPVQEMSDARQAIRAAESAGADSRLADARRLLELAQSSLEAGAYGEARHRALDAREAALRARDDAEREAGLR